VQCSASIVPDGTATGHMQLAVSPYCMSPADEPFCTTYTHTCTHGLCLLWLLVLMPFFAVAVCFASGALLPAPQAPHSHQG
jgi:hypothetical protein